MQSSAEPTEPGRIGVARAAEFVAWCAAFVFARLALVLSFGDVFAYLEEFEKAAAGKALLDGLDLELHQFAYHPYEGGGFVVSCLDALAFAVFGESVLVVKLVAIALGVALLAAGWTLCSRAGGVACARCFALLYVLAPESVQQNSLLALGIHYEAMVFVALALLGVHALLSGATGLRAALGTGLALGFGFYFNFQLALTGIVVLGAVLLAARRRGWTRTRADLAWIAAGAALGAAPLAWMSANVGGAVFDIHGADVLATKTPKLELLRQFAESLVAGRSWLDLAGFTAMLATPWLGLFAFRSQDSLRRLASLVAAHAALFLAAYVGLGFTIGKVVSYFLLHRISALWFLGVLASACGFAALWSSPSTVRRKLAVGALALAALAGARDLVSLVRAASPGDWSAHARTLASTKGYAYPQYLQKLSPRLELERLDKARVFLGFDEEDRELLLDGVAAVLHGDGATPLEVVESDARALGLEHDAFTASFGMALRNQLGGGPASRLEWVAAQPPERRARLAEAIGRFGMRYFPTADAVERELAEGVAAGAPPEFFFGLGMRMWNVRGDARRAHYHSPSRGPWAFDRRAAEALMAAQPRAVAENLRAGYEFAAALQRLDGVDSSRR